MSISNRQEQIMNILNERIFVTVNELAKLTFTSTSSIRRDLTYLQNNGFVKRSHGGVSLPEPISKVASFLDRTQKNIIEKRLIAKIASSFLKDGQTIMLDSSSTATFLLPYIAKLKDVRVFTNNLSTALNAIELGIAIHCLGGNAVNGSVVLCGAETYLALSDIKVDILFFSSHSLDSDGNITDPTETENYVRKLMLKSANKSVFLCDNKKFNASSTYKLCNLNDIDFAVFDSEYCQLKTDCKVLFNRQLT